MDWPDALQAVESLSKELESFPAQRASHVRFEFEARQRAVGLSPAQTTCTVAVSSQAPLRSFARLPPANHAGSDRFDGLAVRCSTDPKYVRVVCGRFERPAELFEEDG